MPDMVPQAKGHRHTRSAALPPAAALPNNPQNPHHLNSQSDALNSQPNMNLSPPPKTPPQTPRRNNVSQPSAQKATPKAPETGSKKRPRNQRPKNVNTSPAVPRNGRNTPPGAQSTGFPSFAKPIATPSTAAFAGPTFHASPAPSALPIPSFYSKSVPDTPGMKNLKTVKESSLSLKPSPTQSNTEVHREESPLDFFFKADREEKARARSVSSAQNALAATGPFQPPAESPRTSHTPPLSAAQHSARRAANRISSGGIFAMELDGESSTGAPIGPAFSTPYSERINAAKTTSEETEREANQNMSSEALKAYLFSGHQLPSPTTTPGSDGHVSPRTPAINAVYRNPSASGTARSSGPVTRAQTHGTAGRTSGLRQEVTPTSTPSPIRNNIYANSPTPTRRYGNTSSSDANNVMGRFTPHAASSIPALSYGDTSKNTGADLQGMEDSLRRILKMDSAGSPGPVGKLPAATASVPNCVGGRPPPMSGMHNGVMGS